MSRFVALPCLLVLVSFQARSFAAPSAAKPFFQNPQYEDYYIDFLEDSDPETVFVFGPGSSLSIHGKDQPIGYLQTLDPYENYELSLEYKLGDEKAESGIMIHSGDDPYRSIWPYSIEIQINEKDTGDLWLYGIKLEVENEEQIPEKSSEKYRRLKLKQKPEYKSYLEREKKPKSEWKKLRIVAKDDTLEVYLDDKLVNKATDLSSTSGYITFQEQESDVEFRNVTMKKL